MRRIEHRSRLIPLLVVIGLGLAMAADAQTPEAPAATAQTQEAEVSEGEKLFNERTCFTCHGKDGKTPILPDYPILAGQNAAYALRQMQDIKSGARANGYAAAMSGVMHLVNDDEMKILADYISKLPR